MMTEPLTKLIIVNDFHLQDNISHFSFKSLTQYLDEKGFILTQQIDYPDISIFKNKSIKLNEKTTHIHFGLNDNVQRVFFYISNM